MIDYYYKQSLISVRSVRSAKHEHSVDYTWQKRHCKSNR